MESGGAGGEAVGGSRYGPNPVDRHTLSYQYFARHPVDVPAARPPVADGRAST